MRQFRMLWNVDQLYWLVDDVLSKQVKHFHYFDDLCRVHVDRATNYPRTIRNFWAQLLRLFGTKSPPRFHYFKNVHNSRLMVYIDRHFSLVASCEPKHITYFMLSYLGTLCDIQSSKPKLFYEFQICCWCEEWAIQQSQQWWKSTKNQTTTKMQQKSDIWMVGR